MGSTKETKGTWGGARPGAGRKKHPDPFHAPHASRPTLDQKVPFLVTLRLRRDVPSFRHPELWKAFYRGSLRARRFGIRIIEYRIEPRRAYLLCEAKDPKELERSFKSLCTTIAIATKRAFFEKTQRKHEGPVFLDRFHLQLLETPERVRWALRQVVAGGRDARARPKLLARSSAIIFPTWKWTKIYEADEPGLANLDARLRSLKETLAARLGTTLTDLEKQATEITASPQFRLTREGWLPDAPPETPGLSPEL